MRSISPLKPAPAKHYLILVAATASLAIQGSLAALAAPSTSNLVFWADATNVDGASNTTLVNGSPISAWLNLAPALQQDGVSQVALTTGTQPKLQTNTLNGRSVVRFNGVNDFLQSTPFTAPLTQPLQVLLVWRAFSTGGSASIAVDGLSTGRDGIAFENSGPSGAVKIFSTSTVDWNPSDFATSIPALETTMVYNGASSTISSNYDATTHIIQPTDSLKITGNPGTQSLAGVTLGGRFAAISGDQFGLDGYIAEVLIYSTPLTGSSLTNTETYLYDKWFINPVPEPATLSVLAAGSLLFVRRSSKKLTR